MHQLNALLSERLPAPIKVGLRRLAFVILRIVDAVSPQDDFYPPGWMPLVGSGDFRAVGELYFNYFTTLAGLKPTDSVLDVGCGLGRMAIPLTGYLDPAQGRYVGFDIEPEAIEWCHRHITHRFPRFEFRHIRAANPNYIPDKPDNPFSHFPFADATFDFVIVTSVFTHMLPTEVSGYLAEISRVLKPGGRCLMTLFLLNAESSGLIAAKRSPFQFVHDYQTYRVINPRLPQAAVAYPEAQVVAWLAECGLSLQEPIYYGNWCGRSKYVDGQDIIIVVRQGP